MIFFRAVFLRNYSVLVGRRVDSCAYNICAFFNASNYNCTYRYTKTKFGTEPNQEFLTLIIKPQIAAKEGYSRV